MSPKYPKSGTKAGPESTQLSPSEGVVTGDMSSVAVQADALGLPRAQQRGGATVVVSYEGLTDAEVMLRVKAGDDAAFDHLVEKFRRPIISFMYRMARNQAVAEELGQEVFLRIYRSRHTYAAEAKFTTWLYRIATNLAVNHARD